MVFYGSVILPPPPSLQKCGHARPYPLSRILINIHPCRSRSAGRRMADLVKSFTHRYFHAGMADNVIPLRGSDDGKPRQIGSAEPNAPPYM